MGSDFFSTPLLKFLAFLQLLQTNKLRQEDIRIRKAENKSIPNVKIENVSIKQRCIQISIENKSKGFCENIKFKYVSSLKHDLSIYIIGNDTPDIQNLHRGEMVNLDLYAPEKFLTKDLVFTLFLRYYDSVLGHNCYKKVLYEYHAENNQVTFLSPDNYLSKMTFSEIHSSYLINYIP